MADMTYIRGCLQGYCTWSHTGRSWPRFDFYWRWHQIWCRWARWPDGKELPPTVWDQLKEPPA